MLDFGQAFGRLHHSLQAFVVKLVCRGPSSTFPKHSPHRNHVIFFGNVLMDRIISETSERTFSAGEENFNFAGGRIFLDSLEDLAGFGLI